MILSDDPGSTVVLPGSGTDGIRQLTSLSNIQEPGKWLFKVDQSRVQPCPDGSSNPPYCAEGGSRGKTSVPSDAFSFYLSRFLSRPVFYLGPNTPVVSTRPRPAVGSEGESETVTFPSFITVIPAILTPGRPNGGANSSPNRPAGSRPPFSAPNFAVTVRPSLSELFNISSRGEPGDNVGFSVGTPPQPAIVLVTPGPRPPGVSGGSRLPQFIFSNPTGPTFVPAVQTGGTNLANSNPTPIDSIVVPTRPEIPFSRPDILIRPETPQSPGATNVQPTPTVNGSGNVGSTDLVLNGGNNGENLFPPLQVFTTSPPRTTQPSRNNRPEGPRLLTGTTSRPSRPPLVVDNKIEESEPQELSSPSSKSRKVAIWRKSDSNQTIPFVRTCHYHSNCNCWSLASFTANCGRCRLL